MRPKFWTRKRLAELEYLTQKYTFSEIAKRYDVTASAISMVCSRHSIKGKQRNRNLRGVALWSTQERVQRDPFGAARL